MEGVNMKKTIITFISLISLLGCASLSPISPTFKTIDIPIPGVTNEAELGDSIVQKGTCYQWQGIYLKNEIKVSGLGLTITLTPQKLAATYEDNNRVYYMTDKMLWEEILWLQMTKKYVVGGLSISKNDKNDIRIWAKHEPSIRTKPEITPIVEFTEIVQVEQSSFKQELIYNGRSSEAVKFLYREISGSTLKAPFSQELQYDLRDGNTIGFKGLRVEIIEANNMKLKYKLISNFANIQN